VLEAFILWKLFDVNREQRLARQVRTEEESLYIVKLMFMFGLTMLIWPVAVLERIKLRQKSKAWYVVLLVASFVYGLILFPIYAVIGVVVAMIELGIVLHREQVRMEREEREVMYEVRYVIPSPNRKEHS
jgi:uncharacterized membrane protein YhaH (DUF805 family)